GSRPAHPPRRLSSRRRKHSRSCERAVLDFRPFDALDRRFHRRTGGQRNQVTCRCSEFAGIERYPQFDKEALGDSLGKAGIRYEHFPELGGLRKPKKDSRNTAWRNASFRGYGDYMETEEFRKGVDRLVDLAGKVGPAEIMCAEAVWWRCHRALISDFLKARVVEVIHIVDATKTDSHP